VGKKRVYAAALLFAALFFGLPAASWAQGLYADDVERAVQTANRVEWQAKFDAAKATVAGFRVATLDDFIKINAWHRAFSNDGAVVHRFITAHGERIVCVDVKTQRAVAASGADPNHLPSPPETPPPVAEPAPGGPQPVEGFGLDGSRDENGAARACPAGSFPKLIPPLETFYRFRHFTDIFKKDPDGSRPPPAADGSGGGGPTHQYTIVGAQGDAYTGLRATFNLWLQRVERNEEFTLVQLWVSGGRNSELQTAEAGVQHYFDMYFNDYDNLFIFYTTDGYQNTGCYNLTCAAFVQTDASVVLGGSYPNYSVAGGAQYTATIGFVRHADDGNWWLYHNGTWVGYYPNSLYAPSGIANQGTNPEFGGELIDSEYGGVHTSTEMGSGQFPSAGYRSAAFVSQVQYLDLSLNWQNLANLATYASVPLLWEIGAVNEDLGDPNWLVNFYYGGPGKGGVDDDDDDNDDNDDNDNDDSAVAPPAARQSSSAAKSGCGV